MLTPSNLISRKVISFWYIPRCPTVDLDSQKKEKNNNEEKKKSYEITIDFIKSGSSIKEVAKERKLTLVTVMSHIQQYISEGN